MADNLVYQGQRLRIEYAVEPNGKMPAKEFYEGLLTKEQARLNALFKRLGDSGWLSDNHFRKLEGYVWEFKGPKSRMLCFFDKGGIVVLTNGFKKQAQRTPRREIERANRIREQHLGRGKENV